jgi:hypothetical protein
MATIYFYLPSSGGIDENIQAIDRFSIHINLLIGRSNGFSLYDIYS